MAEPLRSCVGPDGESWSLESVLLAGFSLNLECDSWTLFGSLLRSHTKSPKKTHRLKLKLVYNFFHFRTPSCRGISINNLIWQIYIFRSTGNILGVQPLTWKYNIVDWQKQIEYKIAKQQHIILKFARNLIIQSI